MSDFRIPDSMVQKAFDVLRDNGHAKARAAYEFADKHLKVVLAKAAGASNASSVAQRENEALRSDAYQLALGQFELVAEVYYTAKDKREAAVAMIDAWRTQQSDMRAMGRVG